MDKDEAEDVVGLDVSHHTRISQRGGEKSFFLDILFLTARHSRNQTLSQAFKLSAVNNQLYPMHKPFVVIP